MKKLLESNTSHGQRRMHEVFADFCELSALAIRNSVDRHQWDEREKRYLDIIRRYEREEAERFSKALAMLVEELEAEPTDALGRLYLNLELGNEATGQFFTPYGVSQLIAKASLADAAEKLETRPFLKLSEPTCGSGGLVIAATQALREAGINYQSHLHVTACDIDRTAVHMTYIQLSILHVPALVVHGNALTVETHDVWPTPAHVIGGWNARLQTRAAESAIQEGPLNARPQTKENL